MKEQDEYGHVLCMWFMAEKGKVVWHMRPLLEWEGHAGYKNATARLGFKSVDAKAAGSGSAAAKPPVKVVAKPAAKPSTAGSENGKSVKSARVPKK
jgi:hypothetical protein